MKIKPHLPYALLCALAVALWVFWFASSPKPLALSGAQVNANGSVRSVQLPYLAEGLDRFVVSFVLDASGPAKYRIVPDNCLEKLFVNGNAVSLNGVQGLCDYHKGAELDLPLKNGQNFVTATVQNKGGPGGFAFSKEPGKGDSAEFRVASFLALLLVTFLLLIYKLIPNFFEKLRKNFHPVVLLVLPFLLYGLSELFLRLRYEWLGAFTWDTPIYWAVGRGWLNGIMPWSGIFDTKPPGMYLLSLLSFSIFDNETLTYWFQVFCLLFICVCPVSCVLLFKGKSVPHFLLAAFAGIVLALYAGERSGEVQIESFGAAFGCLAVLAMGHPGFYARKKLWMGLGALGLLGACGFKEPFLFPLAGASLLLCKNFKDWFYRFLAPLGLAIGAGAVLLLVLGVLDDYVNYMLFMQGFWVNRFGSPLERALQFKNLWEDMNAYAWGLGFAVLATLFLPFAQKLGDKLSANQLLARALLALAGFWLTSLAVGMGGEYFNHHYIFALPFYMAAFFALLRAWNDGETGVAKLGLVASLLLMLSVVNLPGVDWKNREQAMDSVRTAQKAEAAYIDSVLSLGGAERYLFLGYNGNHPYGWTRHSPEGPQFVQTSNWLKDIPGMRDTVLADLRHAQLVVEYQLYPELNPEARQILAADFSQEPWESVKRVQRPSNQYRYWFRKRASP
jgi:hypothetical protein